LTPSSFIGAYVAPSTSKAVEASPSRPRMGWFNPYPFNPLILPYFWGLRRPLHQQSATRKRVPGLPLRAQEWAGLILILITAYL